MDQTQALLQPADFAQHYVTFNGLRLHYASEGTWGAPLIVLLHGFPEFWYSWRYQMRPLAEVGYYVVAVDQRGYNLSDKGGPYDVNTLSDDIAGLIQALGYTQAAAVIGHDWGGVVTWVFAARYPELVKQVAVCNVPHPATLGRAVRALYMPQLLRSWYIAFFQLPWLPEQFLSDGDFRRLASSINRGLHEKLSPETVAAFRDAWRQPMALQSMIGWYRALWHNKHDLDSVEYQVKVPALLIWGDNDFALTTQVAEWSRDYIRNLQLRYIPGGSHWIQQDRPAEVTRYLLDFLAKP